MPGKRWDIRVWTLCLWYLDAFHQHLSELMSLVVSEGLRPKEPGPLTVGRCSRETLRTSKTKTRTHVSRNIHRFPSYFSVCVCEWASVPLCAANAFVWPCGVTEFTHRQGNFSNKLYELLQMKQKATFKLIASNIQRSVYSLAVVKPVKTWQHIILTLFPSTLFSFHINLSIFTSRFIKSPRPTFPFSHCVIPPFPNSSYC